MGLAAMASAAINDLRILAVAVAFSAFVAGFLLQDRGVLAGFGSVLLVSLAWAFFVMARSWVEGDLARTHPNCDPCGFVSYAGRLLIITLMSLGTFGVLAAIRGSRCPLRGTAVRLFLRLASLVLQILAGLLTAYGRWAKTLTPCALTRTTGALADQDASRIHIDVIPANVRRQLVEVEGRRTADDPAAAVVHRAVARLTEHGLPSEVGFRLPLKRAAVSRVTSDECVQGTGLISHQEHGHGTELNRARTPHHPCGTSHETRSLPLQYAVRAAPHDHLDGSRGGREVSDLGHGEWRRRLVLARPLGQESHHPNGEYEDAAENEKCASVPHWPTSSSA